MPALALRAVLLWSCFVSAVNGQPCTSHIDASGCRSGGDLVGQEVALVNMSKDEQIAKCGQLCCGSPSCNAWAVHEMYQQGWARNCMNSSLPKGADCCLLKQKGWNMQDTQPDCTSGGRSAAPTPPPTPAPTPTVHGGGNCTSDWDCSLGGECTNNRCVCDAQYTDAHCGVMRLRRAKMNNGVGPSSVAQHTWGGHGMRDPNTGKWTGFFSYMEGPCDLGTWGSNSMIISAVSDTPDGPYDEAMKPVVGPWSHNAMISRHPNGTYFLFHIGQGTHGSLHNCSKTPTTDPFYPFPEGSLEPSPATTHASDSLDGPWRAAPGIPSINNPGEVSQRLV